MIPPPISSWKYAMDHPWTEKIEPFRISGGLYYVGTRIGTSHLLDTGDGLVLIDTGMPQTLYLHLESVRKLGFHPENIRALILTHGHYDHLGAAKALHELTGCEIYLGKEDFPFADGTLDLTCAREIGFEYHEAFQPDHALRDGDVLSFGRMKIRCVHTPGHTPGTMSFFFETEENGKKIQAGLYGGAGLGSMRGDFLKKYALSTECREKFLPGLERAGRENVELFLGGHIWNNDLPEKRARMISGKTNPFIDPEGWRNFLNASAERYKSMIREESIQ